MQGFAERKVMLVRDLICHCVKLHNEAVRMHRVAHVPSAKVHINFCLRPFHFDRMLGSLHMGPAYSRWACMGWQAYLHSTAPLPNTTALTLVVCLLVVLAFGITCAVVGHTEVIKTLCLRRARE